MAAASSASTSAPTSSSSSSSTSSSASSTSTAATPVAGAFSFTIPLVPPPPSPTGASGAAAAVAAAAAASAPAASSTATLAPGEAKTAPEAVTPPPPVAFAPTQLATSFGADEKSSDRKVGGTRKVKIIERPAKHAASASAATSSTAAPTGEGKGVAGEASAAATPAGPDEKELAVIIEGIRASFKQWDLNNDDSISAEELGKVLGATTGLKPTQAMIDSMLSSMDGNRNGKIEWEEFKNACLRKMKIHGHAPPPDVVTDMEQGWRRKHGTAGASS